MIGIQICITPTDRWADVEGAPCRIWRGRTSLGVECLVFVRALGVVDDDETDSTEFDAILEPTGGLSVAMPIAHPGRGATMPITPPGTYARGGKRDDEEDQKYLEGSG